MSFTDWPWRHWRTRRADKPALRLDDVTDGDGVMLLAHNHPQTLLAWLALLQCGARILPVNPQLPRPLLDVLLPQMTLRFALVLNGEYDGLPALALREGEGQGGVTWRAERLASMTLTSGSTGLPKAAVHTCAAHLASAKGVLALMAVSPCAKNSRLSRRYRAVPTPRWCQRSCGDCLIHTIPSR